jgi:pimeloyl-ACP methyl ester carboxylesterase
MWVRSTSGLRRAGSRWRPSLTICLPRKPCCQASCREGAPLTEWSSGRWSFSPTVLLLHGYPFLWYLWRHQIKVLAAAGYRVVAPDQRGYGQTDCPDGIDAYDMTQPDDAAAAQAGVAWIYPPVLGSALAAVPPPWWRSNPW